MDDSKSEALLHKLFPGLSSNPVPRFERIYVPLTDHCSCVIRFSNFWKWQSWGFLAGQSYISSPFFHCYNIAIVHSARWEHMDDCRCFFFGLAIKEAPEAQIFSTGWIGWLVSIPLKLDSTIRGLEVTEALLPGGSLSPLSRAANPLLAT